MVNKYVLGSLFLLPITLKPKKELNTFEFFLHKMTGQSLKLGKFMTDQVANTFGHVRWPGVISTPVQHIIDFSKVSIVLFSAQYPA